MITSLLSALWATIGGRETAKPARFPRPWISAIGLVALVGVGAIALEYLQGDRGLPSWHAALIAVFSVLPIYIMFRSPLWAWRMVVITMLLGKLNSGPNELLWNVPQILVGLVVLFVVALREPTVVVAWAGVLTLFLIGFELQPEHVPGTAILLTALLVLGDQIQRRRRVEQDLEVQSERGQLAEARTRIARELHDVVAHSMSLVAVRAETAPYRLPALPEEAKAEFVALASTARESLNEMRRLLGVLRTDGDAPELAPQPQLSDVGELIASARQAGMVVRADVSVTHTDDALGLTAYRIVQEALSNAARHAPGIPVDVKVWENGGALVIEVRNGPGPHAFPKAPGHGMTGMRERAELLGGKFAAGPQPDGGFAVVATIPVEGDGA